MSGSMVKVTVIKPFSYSVDGFTAIHVKEGETPSIPANMVAGLIADGKLGGETAEKPADGQEHQSAATVPATSETPATGFGSASNAHPMIDIPSDWRVMHHLKQINLAKQIDPAITTKADAVTAIEAYLSAKAE